MRLDIAAGTAVRFEPGQSRTVRLIALHGWPRESTASRARSAASSAAASPRSAPSKQGRIATARNLAARPTSGMFGPTVGDQVRLADTDLFIEVEKDLTIYGEEVKFGGGKVIRDGMGQSQASAARGRGRHRHHQCADRRSLGHREGRYRPQGRHDRRPSARPAIPTCSPASTSSSARARRRSRARARSSPRAASTATSTSSARSRSTTRSIAASRR